MVECQGVERPLFRNDASGKSLLINNILTGVTDTKRYRNEPATTTAGLEAPLKFDCGVNGEMSVDGWKTELKRQAKPE